MDDIESYPACLVDDIEVSYPACLVDAREVSCPACVMEAREVSYSACLVDDTEASYPASVVDDIEVSYPACLVDDIEAPYPACLVDDIEAPYPACVVDDAEVRLVLQLPGLLELAVGPLFLEDLVHKGLVGGLGEPALFVQQGQDAWGVILQRSTREKQEVNKKGNRKSTRVKLKLN